MAEQELPEEVRVVMARVLADLNAVLIPTLGIEAFFDTRPVYEQGRYAGQVIGIIGPEHRRTPWIDHEGRRYSLLDVIGRVMEQDYGKQVILHDGVVSVENDEQRARRLSEAGQAAREPAHREFRDDRLYRQLLAEYEAPMAEPPQDPTGIDCAERYEGPEP